MTEAHLLSLVHDEDLISEFEEVDSMSRQNCRLLFAETPNDLFENCLTDGGIKR